MKCVYNTGLSTSDSIHTVMDFVIARGHLRNRNVNAFSLSPTTDNELRRENARLNNIPFVVTISKRNFFMQDLFCCFLRSLPTNSWLPPKSNFFYFTNFTHYYMTISQKIFCVGGLFEGAY